MLAAVLGLADIGVLFAGGDHPPRSVAVAAAVLGVITLAAVVWAWRGGARGAVWVVIGARVLSALGAVPAFFVSDVPVAARAAAGVLVALTVLCVALLAGARRRSPVAA